MAEIQVIDPLEIATMGMISTSPITVATNGFIVFITEDIIDEIVPPRGGSADGATLIMGPYDHYREEPKKKKKRITAMVVIDGVEYTDSVEVSDLTITAKDIHVEVTAAPTPSLKITVTR